MCMFLLLMDTYVYESNYLIRLTKIYTFTVYNAITTGIMHTYVTAKMSRYGINGPLDLMLECLHQTTSLNLCSGLVPWGLVSVAGLASPLSHNVKMVFRRSMLPLNCMKSFNGLSVQDKVINRAGVKWRPYILSSDHRWWEGLVPV